MIKESLVREGLDLLLDRYPLFDVVRVEWQRAAPGELFNQWVLVDLGQRGESSAEAFAIWPFAIWKTTGAVYSIDANGAVSDDPILVPD